MKTMRLATLAALTLVGGCVTYDMTRAKPPAYVMEGSAPPEVWAECARNAFLTTSSGFFCDGPRHPDLTTRDGAPEMLLTYALNYSQPSYVVRFLRNGNKSSIEVRRSAAGQESCIDRFVRETLQACAAQEKKETGGALP